MLPSESYKMRLRPRPSAANEASSTCQVPPNRRSVLGDVSNRTHQNNSNLIEKETSIATKGFKRHEPTRTKEESKVDNDENENAPDRRRSRRIQNISKIPTTKGKRKSSTSPRNERKKKKVFQDKVSYTTENELETVEISHPPTQDKFRAVQDVYRSKRSKFNSSKDHTSEGIITTVDNRRDNKIDVLQVASSSSSSGTAKLVLAKEVPRPQTQEKSLVPEIYRLQRSTFNGQNHTLGIAPHDRRDKKDILQVTHYVTDLFQHLYAAETKTHPTMYMSRQPDINSKMRAILVDWLIEVHMKFRLVPETLYLCINVIDRYCKIVHVPRNKLQLVGVTALLIACKYEEIYPPEVRDCVFITDSAFEREEILAMEHDILGRLNYRISVSTAYPFILRFLNLTEASTLSRHAANYYMERTLQEHDLLQFRPSHLSAASVVLALCNPDIKARENKQECEVLRGIRVLLDYTGFRLRDISLCAALIAKKISEEPVTASKRQLAAVKRKYESRKFLHISAAVHLPHASYIPKMERDD